MNPIKILTPTRVEARLYRKRVRGDFVRAEPSRAELLIRLGDSTTNPKLAQACTLSFQRIRSDGERGADLTVVTIGSSQRNFALKHIDHGPRPHKDDDNDDSRPGPQPIRIMVWSSLVSLALSPSLSPLSESVKFVSRPARFYSFMF